MGLAMLLWHTLNLRPETRLIFITMLWGLTWKTGYITFRGALIIYNMPRDPLTKSKKNNFGSVSDLLEKHHLEEPAYIHACSCSLPPDLTGAGSAIEIFGLVPGHRKYLIFHWAATSLTIKKRYWQTQKEFNQILIIWKEDEAKVYF